MYKLVKRRGAAESSMDFTISLPRFARRRVPRFARLGCSYATSRTGTSYSK